MNAEFFNITLCEVCLRESSHSMSNKNLISHVCLIKSMLQWIVKSSATEFFNKNDIPTKVHWQAHCQQHKTEWTNGGTRNTKRTREREREKKIHIHRLAGKEYTYRRFQMFCARQSHEIKKFTQSARLAVLLNIYQKQPFRMIVPMDNTVNKILQKQHIHTPASAHIFQEKCFVFFGMAAITFN